MIKSCLRVVFFCSFLVLLSSYVSSGFQKERSLIANDLSFQLLKNQVFQELEGSWCSREKASLLMDCVFLTRPKVCVEVGVFTGSSLLPVAVTLKHLKRGKVFAVDAWDNEEAVRYSKKEDANKMWWSSIDMKAALRAFSQSIDAWKLNSYVRIIAKPSVDAVFFVPSIDFIHIDGNPSKEGFLQDLLDYLPKVKVGGYVLFSNLLVSEGSTLPKVEALFSISDFFASYELIEEIEGGNVCLLKKSSRDKG